MDGTADLWWPDDLNLDLSPVEETGEIWFGGDISLVTSVRVDLDVFSWETDFDLETMEIDGEAVFDPFLLGGGEEESVTVSYDGDPLTVLEWEETVTTGVDVVFTVDMAPVIDIVFSGVQWENEGDIVAVADDGFVFNTNKDDDDAVDLTSGFFDVAPVFVGAWDTSALVLLQPSLSVCIDYFGCTELIGTEYDIDMSEDAFEQEFEPTELSFPVPLIEVETGIDFGELEIGQNSSEPLVIENLGQLDLEGEIELSGSSAFLVFPETVAAAVGSEDGLMITFAPDEEGTFEGILSLATNDPANPSVDIVLTGIGYEVEADDTGLGATDEGDDADDGKRPVLETEVKGCGCASAHPAKGLGWLALLGFVFVQRRRFTGAPSAR